MTSSPFSADLFRSDSTVFFKPDTSLSATECLLIDKSVNYYRSKRNETSFASQTYFGFAPGIAQGMYSKARLSEITDLIDPLGFLTQFRNVVVIDKSAYMLNLDTWKGHYIGRPRVSNEYIDSPCWFSHQLGELFIRIDRVDTKGITTINSRV